MGDPPSERPAFLGLIARYLLAAARAKIRAAVSRGRPPADGSPIRAVFLSAYPEDHHGTVSRLSRWLPHLEDRNIRAEVFCSTTADEFAGLTGGLREVYRYRRRALKRAMRNLRTAASADVVWLHRGLLPFGPWQRPTFEAALARRNPRLVYDFYDSIWVQRRAAYGGALSQGGGWLNPPDLVEKIIRLSAAVTVSNDHLAAFAAPHHDRIQVLPMLLDPDDYRVRSHVVREPVILGWAGGPQNLRRLESLAPALRRAAAEVPLRLRVISSKRVAIPGVDVDSLTHPWSPRSESRDFSSFDIGLLPMFDDEEDRGKSPLKLLQYAATGLPIISSPVAVDPRAFRDGEAILFADTEDAWVEAIVRLARDVALRERLGAAARKALERHYSFAAHADAFAKLLEETARR